MSVNLLKYPKKSHRKRIKIPKESVRLAELMGIEFGDGGIGNSWQIIITLNAEKDAKYARYVQRLILELFGINAAVRKRGERTLQIVSSSTSLVDFLVKKGAIRGNKIKQHFDIPDWVRKNRKYEKAFVRGLVDTDGCLYIHRHTVKGVLYKNIGFCFTSGSRNLLNSVADIFREFGIKPHITDGCRRIYLYDKDSVVKYLHTFGSVNPRISNLYKKWKGA
ncbi:MAG: LAGLIDADG family homing endonuclease [Patescibacteria group bacterium]